MALLHLYRVLILFLSFQANATPYELYGIADRLELEGDYKGAAEYYMRAVQADSTSPQLYTALTNVLYRLGRFDEGIAWAEKGLRIFPDYSRFYISIATGYLGKMDFKQSIKYYRAAVTAGEHTEDSYLAIATLYEIMSDIPQARQCLLDVPETDRTSAIYFQLGTLSGKLNDHGAAVEYYRKSCELDTTDLRARLGLATGFDYLGIKDSSIYYYEQTVPIDSSYTIRKRLVDLYSDTDQYEKLVRVAQDIIAADHFEDAVRRSLGFAYYKLGDTTAALDQFLYASRLNPNDTYSRFYVGKIHLEHGRYDAARAEIETALRINPDFVELWIYLGFVLIDLRQFKTARTAFEEAVYRGADAAETHYLLGFCFELDDEPGLAYHQYRIAVKRDPKNLSYLTALANLCDRSGRLEEAFLCFQTIMAIDTLNSTALNYVGFTLADRAESLEYSLNLVERALAIEPDNGYIIDSRGWIYYRLGRYEEALADLQRALELVEDAVILEHLGDVQAAMNDREQALLNYLKAFGLDPKNRKLLKKIRAMQNPADQ